MTTSHASAPSAPRDDSPGAGGAPRPPRLVVDAMRFSAVGALSYVLDVVVFNLLRLSGLPFLGGPLPAKTAGVVIATLFAWLGSRYYTFKRHKRPDPGREFVEFVIVAGIGYGINVGVLYLSHYVFGFHSLLADNLAANIVGALLASAVRFVLYRWVVYRPGRSHHHERSTT
jgi:putative flippase GtrA